MKVSDLTIEITLPDFARDFFKKKRGGDDYVATDETIGEYFYIPASPFSLEFQRLTAAIIDAHFGLGVTIEEAAAAFLSIASLTLLP